MVPTHRTEYDGRWSPEVLAEYVSAVNQDRFTPAIEIMETINATLSFADDWRREFKDQALETCWETIEKVDFGKILGGALGKAPGIDGQKASTGR